MSPSIFLSAILKSTANESHKRSRGANVQSIRCSLNGARNSPNYFTGLSRNSDGTSSTWNNASAYSSGRKIPSRKVNVSARGRPFISFSHACPSLSISSKTRRPPPCRANVTIIITTYAFLLLRFSREEIGKKWRESPRRALEFYRYEGKMDSFLKIIVKKKFEK